MLALLGLLVLAGCGGRTGSQTRYWVTHTSNQGDLYLSTTVSNGQIAGYFSFPGNQAPPRHYTGVENADKTFSTAIYNGLTLEVGKDSLNATMTSSGTVLNYEQISKSEWEAGTGATSGGAPAGSESGVDESPDSDTGSPLNARAGTFSLVLGPEAAPNDVVIYEDFASPSCRQFDQRSFAVLTAAAEAGRARVEYRPFVLLSSTSYSADALRAFGAVLQNATGDQALAFHRTLFGHQPGEHDAAPTTADLTAWAAAAGASPATVAQVIGRADETFAQGAAAAAARDKVAAVPTVLVNGTVVPFVDGVDAVVAQLDQQLAAG